LEFPVVILPENSTSGWYYFRGWLPNDWRPRYAQNPSILLQDKTALLLGYGEIGSRLAKILHALDMHILAIRNSISSLDMDRFAMVYPQDSIHSLLPQADILINTLPLTPQTKGMIGEKELAALQRGAVVVNVGRGEVIDQHAFYQALKNGHLGAAAIDVWYNYPEDEASRADTMPADVSFGELKNVVLSPHRAGGLNSEDTERLRMEHLADLLNHAARGEPLPNQVDLTRGY
jgi:phosphoglycerate dehydrogenase-like enzyme